MDLVLASLNYPPAIGGVEQLCERLAHHLSALGVSLHVVAPAHAGDRDFDAAASYPVTRYAAGLLRQPNLARVLSRVAGPRVPVLFGQWTAASLTLAARGATGRRAPVFSLGHGKEFLLGGSPLRRSPAFARYMEQVIARLDLLVANSHYTAALARERGARRVEVVNPGVDLERFAPQGPRADAFDGSEGPRLLTVTRLVPRKGVDTMLEALPGLLADHPGLRYCVAGEGPDRGRLEALAQRLGVAASVRFLGRVEHAMLPALYRSADVMVLASRLEPERRDVEGFGIVLLEAQASGTPVVASRSGGMPDAVAEGDSGLLVPEADPVALHAALSPLLADAARLSAMSRAARDHAAGRGWRASAERLLGLLPL